MVTRSPRRKIPPAIQGGLRRVAQHRSGASIHSAAARDSLCETSFHKRQEVSARAFAGDMEDMRENLVEQATIAGQDPILVRRGLNLTIRNATGAANRERVASIAARKRAVAESRSAATARNHATRLRRAISVHVAKLNPRARLRGAAKKLLDYFD